MLKLQSKANIPTDFGEFCFMAFSESESDLMPLIVAVAKNTDVTKVVNVRLHSECITGEVFHSKKCECGQQLDAAMKFVQENSGVIIYLRQEGRNIGIINKLKAYALQEKGWNTVEANLELGFPADNRNYSEALEVLNQLKIKKINLLTNNPEKLSSIETSHIELVSRIALQIKPNGINTSYLETKKTFFRHLLD